MNSSKAAFLALVSTAMLSASAFACDGEGRRGPDRQFGGPGFGIPAPGMIMGRMADRLDLDDTQRESVKNIMESAKPELQALREKLRANHDALKALEANDPEAQNIAISNGELATEGTLLASRIRGEIDAVLTVEQRAQLAEMKEARQENRQERGERRKERR
ncbi:MAG: Spy/CpxP family protein refolding chaperone [Gammaproteobacteria bacterium]|nr:Spy/CpxP family protein refolding chaperone [Gammaproteobacteria bacterium]